MQLVFGLAASQKFAALRQLNLRAASRRGVQSDRKKGEVGCVRNAAKGPLIILTRNSAEAGVYQLTAWGQVTVADMVSLAPGDCNEHFSQTTYGGYAH